jgi:hypothetical protein
MLCGFLLASFAASGARGYAESGVIVQFEVTPTVFFARENGTLVQVLNATIENRGNEITGSIRARVGGRAMMFPLKRIEKGKRMYPIRVPEVRKTEQVLFTLNAGAETREFSTVVSPSRKWTVYLFHHSHSDIGYTELQSRIARKHVAYLDSVIEYCRQTNDYPDGAQFKWNVEITWSLDNFISQRPESRVRELMDLVKAGRVEVSAWNFNMSDMFSHEELIRNLSFAGELSRRWGIEVVCAMNNDVNGFSWGSPQILSKAGVRYFATGINETRSLAPLNRPCAFWWESTDGSRILHWNGEHYLFSNYALLVHEGCDASAPKVSEYLSGLERRGDYPYDITAMNVSAYVTDNCPPGRRLSDIVREWNGRWEYPKLRLAAMREFFEALEKRYGDRIPTYRLGWPDYWTDGAASTAFETGLNRVTHSELISAEKFSAVAGRLDRRFSYPAKDIDDTYRLAMLYDEHTWGAYNSISEPYSELARGQWAIKSSYSYLAREQSREILGRALDTIAGRIPSGGAYTLAVFNPLSWERTDVVRAALPHVLAERKGAFLLTDRRTGSEVPFQMPDANTILFTARDVPSMGYAVYTAAADRAPAPSKQREPRLPGALENRFYRVALDPATGGVTSIFDKELNAELVDSRSPYTMNQYVYENPDGGRQAVDDMNRRAKFTRHSPSSAVFAPGMEGAVATSLTAKTSAKPCPLIEQEVILYDDIKRIDITNTLTKDETLEPEALYYAFPFAARGGKLRFEIADGAMTPEVEQLPKTTRDWMTVQNWIEISGGEYTVVWSPIEAPLVQFCDINTGKWLKKLDITNSWVFSYAMNNYWMTNFKAGQGGKMTFRYAITSRRGGSDDLASSRFGWERHTPLAAVWAPEGSAGTLPPKSYSFLSVDAPNVIVQAFKRAGDGEGVIVRLREIAGRATEVSLSSPLFPAGKTTAMLTNIFERDGKPCRVKGNSVTVPLAGFGIETVRITAQP